MMQENRGHTMFKNKPSPYFSILATEKKPTGKKVAKRDQPETKETAPGNDSSSAAESMPKEDGMVKSTPEPRHATRMPADDMGIVIVEDDIQIDQERVNEERRAYLEEARSQEVFD